jgi:undecaprenyl-diphosphatase
MTLARGSAATALFGALLIAALELGLTDSVDADARWALVGLLSSVPPVAWGIVSAPGSSLVTLPAMAITAILLWAQRRRVAAAGALLAVGGGYGLMHLVKWAVGRPRPPADPASVPTDLWLGGWDPDSGAFPSGHAMLALITYGYLAASLPERHRAAGAVVAGAIALVVGVARIALGAHWPVDVLGGWALGAAWLLGVLAVRRAAAGA